MPSIPEGARRLGGTEYTKITRISQSHLSSTCDNSQRPCSEVWVSDLSLLEVAPPFVASIKGIVSSIGVEGESQAGIPMLPFKIHDSQQRYVECMACGRHGAIPLLQEGFEIALYFVRAKAGSGGADGQLFVYDDAHLVLLRRDCIVPPRKSHASLIA